MAKGGRVTYDEANPAYVETSAGRIEFPPFSTLTAAGIEQCAIACGIYGDGPRAAQRVRINHSLREAFPSE
jgi:hypothetical protein